MAETTNTLAVAPPLLTVRALLYGPVPIPVKGLFIAFKLKPASPGDKAARLAETLRDTAFQKMRDDTPAKKRNKARDSGQRRSGSSVGIGWQYVSATASCALRLLLFLL